MTESGSHRAESIDDSDAPQTINIEAIPEAVLIAESRTYEIAAANDAAGDLFGCQPATLSGMSIEDLFPMNTLESVENYAEAFERGHESKHINQLQNGQTFEIETLDRNRKPVELLVKETSKTDHDWLICVFREITERIEQEEEPQLTTSRLNKLLELLPIPVTAFSPDGVVQEWNQAAEDAYGYRSSEMIGETFPLFTDDDELHKLKKEIVETGSLDEHQTVYQRQDGSQVDVELYARPVYKEKELFGIIVASINITDKQQRLQRIKVLQRTLRHNIRNKLNVVQGHLKSLERELEYNIDSVQAAITATNEILTRAETARQTQAIDSNRDLTEQSISDLTTAAIHDYRKVKGLTIKNDVEDISVKVITGFDIAIEHAIENAVKHTTPPTTIEISTSVMSDRIELIVEDNGEGISEAEVRVLESADETPLEHGSGIGLWAMKWFTERSGGRFGIKSDSTGTVVSMQLPRAND